MQCVFTLRSNNEALSFPRSRVGMHPGTLLRPGSPSWERTGKVAVSPPVSDAGASGDFRSHAGGW